MNAHFEGTSFMPQYDDTRHALIDVEQSVTYARHAIARELDTLLVRADDGRVQVPVELITFIQDFAQFDPEARGLNLGQYIFHLIVAEDLLIRRSDLYIGYEFDLDVSDTNVTLIVEPVTVAI